MGRKRPNWRFNEAHVSEELKITVALALKKLMQNGDQKGEILSIIFHIRRLEGLSVRVWSV